MIHDIVESVVDLLTLRRVESIVALRNPDLRERHWDHLTNLLGKQPSVVAKMKVIVLLSCDFQVCFEGVDNFIQRYRDDYSTECCCRLLNYSR